MFSDLKYVVDLWTNWFFQVEDLGSIYFLCIELFFNLSDT
jgi:hypothetical protein